MRRILLAGIASAAVFASLPAMAAVNLVSAAVTGPSGTVWDTTANSYYTLFLQNPFGNNINPNDEAVNFAVPTSGTDFNVAGDGWTTNTKGVNSDAFYNLTLTLTDGSTSKIVAGTYTPTTGIFVATTGAATFGGTAYALTDFNWTRGLSNIVGQFSVASKTYAGQPIGSKSDYQGAFTLETSAVPEPATWAMMISGFGLVGAAMRRRAVKTTVTYA